MKTRSASFAERHKGKESPMQLDPARVSTFGAIKHKRKRDEATVLAPVETWSLPHGMGALLMAANVLASSATLCETDVQMPPNAHNVSSVDTQGEIVASSTIRRPKSKARRIFHRPPFHLEEDPDLVASEPRSNTTPGKQETTLEVIEVADESKEDQPERKRRQLNRSNASKIITSIVSSTEVGGNKRIMLQIKMNPDFKAKVKRGPSNPYGLTHGHSPYPYRVEPTAKACQEVYDILTRHHGEVRPPEKVPPPSLNVAGCGEVPSVLDALLRTLISGNTLMARADEAVRGLVKVFGTVKNNDGIISINWNKVRLSPLSSLVEAIKPAGCNRLKGQEIKTILDMVYEANSLRLEVVDGTTSGRQGVTDNDLSLEHFRQMTKQEALDEFVKFPGVGVKTAACVTLFCLQIPCFAVDTHVHKFSKWLAWVPSDASELDTFNHCDYVVPERFKYGLHQLFIRHGQQCFKCRKATRPGTSEWNNAPECPLEYLLNRSKTGAK
ncbi:hypothetical protein VTK73DRAFT_2493 [Phialemonium thermophilum]|uniref:HhH-GPD domain-containing protein n=1 Tax=Phialemonium thermophilum TaxID=223376 RepID=A0ABR3Y1G5_9PEZI